jgi:hypothetical protein
LWSFAGFGPTPFRRLDRPFLGAEMTVTMKENQVAMPAFWPFYIPSGSTGD